MRLNELKKKSEKELHKILAETRENLRVSRFKDANKQLKNVREIREQKKMIAWILTLLNNKKDIIEKSVDSKSDGVNDKK